MSENQVDNGPVRRYDGGVRAWSTVIGSFLVQFCIIGLPLSFGVNEGFYARTFLSNYSPSEISWIGSLQLCFMFLLGFTVARLFDNGYFHAISLCGSVIFVFSMFMLSLAKEGQYYEIFLSQGLGMSIGTGIMYLITSSVVAHHFKKRRALAMGLITTGSALGGFFFSSIFGQFLEGPVGFAWGIRIGAFVCLVFLTLANLLMRTNYPLRTETISSSEIKIPTSRYTFLRNYAYIVMLLYGFIIGLALYVPMFSLDLFASEHPTIAGNVRKWLLAIVNLSSVVGRTLPGWLADQHGVLIIYIPCMASAGIVALCMPLCTSSASVVVFSILYGIFSGAAVALFFPTVLSLDNNMSTAGVRASIASIPVGVAFLVGSPLAAALVGNSSNRNWWAGAIFTGVLELACTALLMLAYWLQKGTRGQ